MVETNVQNGRISNFDGPVALTLTLDGVILHTVVHHSATSSCQISLKSKKLFVDGRTDGRTDVCMHGRTFETGFVRSTLSKSRPNNITVCLNFETLHGITMIRVLLMTVSYFISMLPMFFK